MGKINFCALSFTTENIQWFSGNYFSKNNNYSYPIDHFLASTSEGNVIESPHLKKKKKKATRFVIQFIILGTMCEYSLRFCL